MKIIIFLALLSALFCLGYYVFAASYAGIHSAFLTFWLLLAVFFTCIAVAFACDLKFDIIKHFPRLIKIGVSIVFFIGVIIFLIMEVLIYSKMNEKTKEDVDYVIVLGAQVRGTRVTKSLAKRLDVAYEYLLEHDKAFVICTGGMGSGEDITEASAEKDYLIKKGIDEQRIILEDKSTSTYENLKFSMNIINDKNAKIVIATNNFHVYRSMHLAKYVGFKNVYGLAGKSDNRLLLNYMVREGLALFKELVVH